jgi:chromosomal replication initiation ATPase DnaA
MLTDQGYQKSKVVHAVADRFGVTLAELRGRRRWRRLTEPRHIAAWLLWQAGETFEAIGQELNRDHSTMVYAVRKVERKRKGDLGYLRVVMGLWRATVAPQGGNLREVADG